MFALFEPTEPLPLMLTATWPVSDPFELALWLGRCLPTSGLPRWRSLWPSSRTCCAGRRTRWRDVRAPARSRSRRVPLGAAGRRLWERYVPMRVGLGRGGCDLSTTRGWVAECAVVAPLVPGCATGPRSPGSPRPLPLALAAVARLGRCRARPGRCRPGRCRLDRCALPGRCRLAAAARRGRCRDISSRRSHVASESRDRQRDQSTQLVAINHHAAPDPMCTIRIAVQHPQLPGQWIERRIGVPR